MTEKKDDSLFTFTVAWTFVLMIAGFIVFVGYTGMFPQGNGYWDSAPDGVYHTLPSCWTNTTVSFPQCPSCPTQLHGTWTKNVDVIIDWNNAWWQVTLKDNVIVKAEMEPIDTSTVYGEANQWNYEHRNATKLFLQVVRADPDGDNEWSTFYEVELQDSEYSFQWHTLFSSQNLTESLQWAINHCAEYQK